MIDNNLIYLHEYLKTSQKDYLILFDNLNLNETINVVKKFTKNFIVLNNFKYRKSDFSNAIVKYINTKSKLHKHLHNIFVGNALIEDIAISKSTFNAIYFTISSSVDINLKKYEYFLLFNKLPDSFYVNDIIFNDNTTILISYTNQKSPREFKIQSNNKPTCIFLGYGIGEFFITSSFLYKLVNKYKKIIMIMPSSCSVKNLISDLFKDRIEIYEIDNYMVLEKIYKYFIYSGKFSKCYNALFNDYKVMGRFCHYYHLFSEQLYDINVNDPFEYISDLKIGLFSALDDNEKETVNKVLESHKVKVGLQFWTDEPGVGNIGDKRCWSQQNVQELINLNDSELEYYILTPYPKQHYSLNSVIDVGNLSINALICLISNLDYVIGIDSFCGHIAAAFNIPSITLWNKQTPILLSYEFIGLSFRAMRNNFSIIPRSKSINDISGLIVHSILHDCIEKKIILNKNIFSLDYIFNNENTIFV